MKILIVNTHDIQGGAARAAYRLHKALLDNSVDSQMLVQNKRGDDYTVLLMQKTKLQKILFKLKRFIESLFIRQYKNRTQTPFTPAIFSSKNVVKAINSIYPDIVHLHWIAGGMLGVEDIAKIKAPIVWSLHDMWAFTGGCHYDEWCGGYEKKCGNCKVLGSEKEYDLSSKVWSRKQKAYTSKKEMTIVSLSKWLNECSRNSTLLKDKNHINLPNPIDTTIFKPFDKEKARELWSLPQDKKLVLFGAMGATSDPRKGFKELSQALSQLTYKDIEFVVFGSSQPKNVSIFGFKIHYLGNLHDDVSLVTLYSAVDIMVVPSLQENLSNVIMESLACATPVVGFDIGGNRDMVVHQQTGYLAKPFDISDLVNGIEWILNAMNYDELCQNAREKVLNEFDSSLVVQKYMQLYKEILND